MANRRRRSSRSATRARSQKAGAPYEDAVCELFRLFFPASTINAGVWIEGSDGRRELDVDITENFGNRAVHGIIECKDFNPATTGPVGIAYIDALDSKRRDLQLDFAFLCSNAGFTADAVRKAKRVNIGLLSAVRKLDKRIRFAVYEEIYIRHINLTEAPRIRIWPAIGEALPPKAVLESGEAYFDGRPVGPWFMRRFQLILAANPIVNGIILDYCKLKAPIRLDWPSGSAFVEQIGVDFAIEGAWFAQTVRLESKAGLYDWLRRRMRIAPSTHQNEMRIDGVNYFGGKWIAQPPDLDLAHSKLIQYEVDMKLIMLKNHLPLDNPALLTPHVVSEDLSFEIKELDKSSIESTPGFKSDPVPSSEVGKKLWPEIKAEVSAAADAAPGSSE